MKSVDTGYTARKQTNPWDEGDYRIYGHAVLRPDGTYGPAFHVERIRGIPDAPKIAIENCFVDLGNFATADLAKIWGVEHGLDRVRDGRDLLC